MTEIWTLSPDQAEQVTNHLSKWLADGCWVCKANDWSIFPVVTGEKPYDPDADFIAAADSNPKVRLTCKNCGNIAYFSTEVMGLTPTTEGTDG